MSSLCGPSWKVDASVRRRGCSYRSARPRRRPRPRSRSHRRRRVVAADHARSARGCAMSFDQIQTVKSRRRVVVEKEVDRKRQDRSCYFRLVGKWQILRSTGGGDRESTGDGRCAVARGPEQGKGEVLERRKHAKARSAAQIFKYWTYWRWDGRDAICHQHRPSRHAHIPSSST